MYGGEGGGNVQIEEEIGNETEASEMQREEDSDKEEVTAASCTTIRLFVISLECNKGQKHLLLRKGKTVTLFQLSQFYKMTEKYFVNFSKKK
jgi:hypothetical protein